MDDAFINDPIDKYLDIVTPTMKIIMSKEEAIYFLDSLDGEPIALDFETTGLSPLTCKVRLTCLYSPIIGSVVLDHFFCGSFEELVPFMLKPEWIVYNAKFESSWFDHFLQEQAFITDVDFYAKVKLGGHPTSLARMCKRDLGVDLDKTLQTSDWSSLKLTHHQYIYGALDAVLTWFLYDYWMCELTDEQFASAYIYNEVVRPTVECENTGLYLNVDEHVTNIRTWKMKQENALRCLRRIVPKRALDNLQSNKQVSDFIKSQLDAESLAAWPKTGKRKDLALDRKTLGPIAAKAPYPFSRWLNAFILYRYYAKYLSTYGESLVFKQHAAGKVTSRFNIAQAATGRYSSSATNLQNIPRKEYVRKVFHAPYDGETMVLADYSGIEVRVLAELSDDARLRYDTIYGDVHASSAAAIYHLDEDLVHDILSNKKNPRYAEFKEMRSKAKGFTFQLLYGAGDAALSVVLKSSVEDASIAVRKWAERYPKAYGYRQVIFDEMMHTGFIPVVTGRTIYVRRPDRSMPVAANYPVQGAAGDVMCRALTRVYDLNHKYLNRKVRLAATVHDEILEYSAVDCAEKAEALLIEGMKQGWLDVFPDTNTDNLIESAIGDTWAAKP